MATVFVDTGEEFVSDLIVADGAGDTHYVGWGTGAGTTGKTDTTLFTEASESRVGETPTKFTTSSTGDSVRWVAQLTADGSKTITNAGVFDASTSGNLIVKGDFTGVSLNASDSITFTIELQMT